MTEVKHRGAAAAAAAVTWLALASALTACGGDIV